MINVEHYILVAGDPSAWDTETCHRVAAGTSLVDVQRDQHQRGRRSAEILQSVYGWYVRAGSSLDQPAVLASTQYRGGPLDGSYAAAVAWGRAWVAADPTNRELMMRRTLAADVQCELAGALHVESNAEVHTEQVTMAAPVGPPRVAASSGRGRGQGL